MRTILKKTITLLAVVLGAGTLGAQEHPAKRLSNIVGVAVEEYGKGIDENGRMLSEQEYQEAVDFLAVARDAAERLPGARAGEVRTELATLSAAVTAKLPPSKIAEIHKRFTTAIGAEGALELPTGELSITAGRDLYLQSCASCHGPAGRGDGPAAKGMYPPPSDFGDTVAMADATPELLYRVISVGVPGTQMIAWGPTLTVQQRWDVVAYIRSLHGGVMVFATVPADRGGAQAAKVVLAKLDEALAAARSGRVAEANDYGFDAYIAFEPLETLAQAKSPGLVAAMEQQFSNFRGAIKRNDLKGAEKTRDAIELNMPSIVALTEPTANGWAAFLQSLLIIVREGFEAILVVGAVVAFLINTGNRNRLRSIWVGAALGLVASAATAVVLQTALRAMPMSRDLIEGITMLIAVAVLFSVSYWLISKVEAAKWQKFIGEKVTVALNQGGGAALAFVAFLAVYREGAETALFYQALFGEGSHLLVPIVLGIVVGAVILALIFALFYRYGVRIPLRPFFAVTSVLLYYMAFVFMGKGIRELQEVNAFPMTVLRGFPHVDAMGIYPTLETSVGQLLLVVLFIIALVKTVWVRR